MTLEFLAIKLTVRFSSPVVVLLGQDQFNQSAVVVLGDKTSDNLRPGDDISAVIGELSRKCKTRRDVEILSRPDCHQSLSVNRGQHPSDSRWGGCLLHTSRVV